jgi:N-acetylglutamate synthase-like GNAT family acetyltransferase
MEFDIVKKYTAELTSAEIHTLTSLVNDCFYKNTVNEMEVQHIFFSDLEICNLIIEDKNDLVGLFQVKDLPKLESVYFFSASVRKDYRNRGLHSEMIDYRIAGCKNLGRKYASARTMNPVVIGNMVKKGFFLPQTENPELLRKAKEILIELEGSDLGLTDDFVIKRKNTTKYPNLMDTEECSNPEVNTFMAAHMEEGDRLFLIRKV